MPALAKFTLKTTSFDSGKKIPEKYVFNGFGCSGENISPALEWSGAPEGTKSFVITVYDPDAPTGSGWWHWTVANLPATTSSLAEGASNKDKLPQKAVEGRTDYGRPGYGGPCPPKGDRPHRYVFTVYALKTESIPVDAEASGAVVGYYSNANKIGKASFTATYGK